MATATVKGWIPLKDCVKTIVGMLTSEKISQGSKELLRAALNPVLSPVQSKILAGKQPAAEYLGRWNQGNKQTRNASVRIEQFLEHLSMDGLLSPWAKQCALHQFVAQECGIDLTQQ